jgi:hypothetical protein
MLKMKEIKESKKLLPLMKIRPRVRVKGSEKLLMTMLKGGVMKKQVNC